MLNTDEWHIKYTYKKNKLKIFGPDLIDNLIVEYLQNVIRFLWCETPMEWDWWIYFVIRGECVVISAPQKYRKNKCIKPNIDIKEASHPR